MWITSWTPFFAGRSLLQIEFVLHHWKSAPTDDALNACPLVYVVIWTKWWFEPRNKSSMWRKMSQPSFCHHPFCSKKKCSNSWIRHDPPKPVAVGPQLGRAAIWGAWMCIAEIKTDSIRLYQTISDSALQHDNTWQHFANDMDPRQQHHESRSMFSPNLRMISAGNRPCDFVVQVVELYVEFNMGRITWSWPKTRRKSRPHAWVGRMSSSNQHV